MNLKKKKKEPIEKETLALILVTVLSLAGLVALFCFIDLDSTMLPVFAEYFNKLFHSEIVQLSLLIMLVDIIIGLTYHFIVSLIPPSERPNIIGEIIMCIGLMGMFIFVASSFYILLEPYISEILTKYKIVECLE